MRRIQFNQIIGNSVTKNIIMKSLESKGFPKVSLFYGDRGTGKSSCAEITALRLGCENPNGAEPCCNCPSCKDGLKTIFSSVNSRKIRKINMAHIDDLSSLKKILHEVYSMESDSDNFTVIYEEVHILDEKQQTSFLEYLERVPDGVYTIFCTTRTDLILDTLKDRCMSFHFSRLDSRSSQLLIDTECATLGINPSKNLRNSVRKRGEGIPRKIVNILEFIRDNPNITERELDNFIGGISPFVFRTLLKNYSDMSVFLKIVNEVIDPLGSNAYGDFIVPMKDYIMTLGYLSKGLAFRNTDLSSEDKQLATLFTFPIIMGIYNELVKITKYSSISDIDYCLIKVATLLRSKVKVGEEVKDTSAGEQFAEAKETRQSVIKQASSFHEKLDMSKVEVILSENSNKESGRPR